MTSTDDEHELDPQSGPAWIRYEMDIQEALNEMDDSEVAHNVTMKGALSEVDRQVDVLIERQVTGSSIRIAVECKHYRKPLGIGKIDEFAGKLADLQVERGILYALNGLTSGARARAKRAFPIIEVRDLRVSAPPPLPWAEYVETALKFGDCGNPNCPAGDVNWSDWEQADGGPVSAGQCPMCGYWNVECHCGEVTCFVFHEETCVSCGRILTLVASNDGGIEAVTVEGDAED
ncbi:restriction endonuclease [Arthrobacter sp. DNA4]|uniref:restriction endonuclease n=1 Tax=Arthrobacter sp. DNA4 TaxID=2963432 RepID=UPI0020CDE0D2|nr:restriction endonuclease [Arthrobacter sp. DNA4]UTT71163.1 restriction endonuclease [Arthrobacter sp. DNA4]